MAARFFTSKFPIYFNPAKPFLSPSKPASFSLFYDRFISFQKIPTISPPPPQSSSSSSIQLQPMEELPPKLHEIVKLFQSVEEPKAKYEQLIFYGKNLKPLDTQFKTKENKVEGCVSQVWVRAYIDKDKNVIYEADSDSVLTKGLAALLVNGLSGRPVQEILRVSPDFAVLLGLQRSLTPSRTNGFLNMLKLMQRKALELLIEVERAGGSSGNDQVVNQVLAGSSEKHVENSILDSKVSENSVGSIPQKGIEESSTGLGNRGMRIKEKLERELSHVSLKVEDVSYKHAGHAGVSGSDRETHFNLRIVSKEFEGKSLVKRHRLIYGLLDEELQSGLHALSIVAKTPAEVKAK
ncbi:sufE-like protein 1, chloroplastic/mitochondrial [Durio zibethinus]|uniref:SufE-like protein 1, chloroplastic/mitochondrial n=1 Tax=Durio zibethinus TaxID=66656 RepID=A0A6P5ZKQ4_DURZI|nr:sufE-like protein 1, chloroplastic/mitochondrial [Durio zibethinus]XP_022752991.1 sufE-like protein 1, chloroplastic/mitochondrial [Durio zibethinus]